MTSLDQLWQNAQAVTTGALRRADADINGTPRAKARYEAMSPGVRVWWKKIAIDRYGKTGWDDYMKAIDQGEKSNGR